jgi:hypothetical protein
VPSCSVDNACTCKPALSWHQLKCCPARQAAAPPTHTNTHTHLHLHAVALLAVLVGASKRRLVLRLGLDGVRAAPHLQASGSVDQMISKSVVMVEASTVDTRFGSETSSAVPQQGRYDEGAPYPPQKSASRTREAPATLLANCWQFGGWGTCALPLLHSTPLGTRFLPRGSAQRAPRTRQPHQQLRPEGDRKFGGAADLLVFRVGDEAHQGQQGAPALQNARQVVWRRAGQIVDGRVRRPAWSLAACRRGAAARAGGRPSADPGAPVDSETRAVCCTRGPHPSGVTWARVNSCRKLHTTMG